MSRIGLEGITRSKELMQPLRADHAILMALKKRLEDEVMFATCMNCGNQRRFRVVDAPKRFRCDVCDGCMIAVLKEYDRDLAALVKKRDLDKDEAKARMRMSRCANLVNEYGGRAAMVLAGRGIGPDTASRILRSPYIDEDGFLRSILSAEILYAKNKQFWD
jgi:ATP-dependent Lhr-like helicase